MNHDDKENEYFSRAHSYNSDGTMTLSQTLVNKNEAKISLNRQMNLLNLNQQQQLQQQTKTKLTSQVISIISETPDTPAQPESIT